MMNQVQSLNEYKYEKYAEESVVDLRQDNTYYAINKRRWTGKEYAKAYMEMLTVQANRNK